MSEEYVYTYGDIVVSPYKFEKIKKLKITRELNEHGRLYISGIISDENEDKYVEVATAEESIKVSVKDDEGNVTDLFQGIVTNISISANNDVRTLEIEALSKTFLMDIKEKSRSFQNEESTYGDIFTIINSGYSNIQNIDNVTYGAKIDKLIVQYRETDWEFVKRLASHFNGGIVSECQLTDIKYSLGGAGYSKVFDLNEFNYSIKKGLHEYKVKSANEAYELDDMNLVSYEITSNRIMNLYNQAAFKGRKLFVYKCEIEMVGGVLSNKYILRDEKGMKVRKLYNNNLVGVSLQGRVLSTEKDNVKVSLEIDGSPTEREGVRWFEYATVFSSPDGTGWYCMPEIEDVVRLYFPDNEEKHSCVISSVNLQSSDSTKRSDPSVKSFSTKYGKEIIMRPGAIDIISGGNSMSLNDDGGIQVNSDSQISMSGSSINISGGDVSIHGDGGVTLSQSGASIVIKDDVVMSGAKINTQ
ncbi:hypothetical protein psyc5s11_35280 [Clostridium gelidum]|uniref:Phage tail protein n=1 Tax=Clostridium gelidum TaxID=704125 RepID=A0ABN6J388_9CLOT|nr:contractile injection system protein, VgrG/Pvc8 family [Clostridium gelidum]BCZ47461.1 hypothetical protein psyc5s11_35280 [Clostridium gelidum]